MNAAQRAVDALWPSAGPRPPATAPSVISQRMTRSQTAALGTQTTAIDPVPTTSTAPDATEPDSDQGTPPLLQLDETEVIVQTGASAAAEERRHATAEAEFLKEAGIQYGILQSDVASVYSLAPSEARYETKLTTKPDTDIQKLIQNFSKISVNDTAFTPKPFGGKGRNAGEAEKWLRYFNNYTSFRNIEGEAKLQLFMMLMAESETDWIRSLPADITTDLDKLTAEFRSRHALTPVDIWTKTVGLWERIQKADETSDDYIAGMQVIASSINLPDDQLCHVIIKGLREDTQLFCLQSGANDLAAIKSAARISEAAQAARQARTRARQQTAKDQVMVVKSTPPASPRHQPSDEERQRTSAEIRARPAQLVRFERTERQQNQQLDRPSRGGRPNYQQNGDGPDRNYGNRRSEETRNRGSEGYSGIIQCRFCGFSHLYGRSHCRAKDTVCYRCESRGHYARYCMTSAENNYTAQTQNRPRPR